MSRNVYFETFQNEAVSLLSEIEVDLDKIEIVDEFVNEDEDELINEFFSHVTRH